MTPHERDELYILQRHFGISADEALFRRPAWEIDNLMSGYAREIRDREPE